jgi:hypothetical protein
MCRRLSFLGVVLFLKIAHFFIITAEANEVSKQEGAIKKAPSAHFCPPKRQSKKGTCFLEMLIGR